MTSKITEVTTHPQTGEVTVLVREQTQADRDWREFDESTRRFLAEMHGGGSLDDEADRRAAEEERRAARRAARRGAVPAVTPPAPGSQMDLFIQSRRAFLASRKK